MGGQLSQLGDSGELRIGRPPSGVNFRYGDISTTVKGLG
jgi:hypothetical protein